MDICREAPMYESLLTVYVSTAGSVHATSIAASRVEQALSEVASSLQSSAPKQGPLHPWMTLAQIWLHAGTNLTHSPNLHHFNISHAHILLLHCSGLGLINGIFCNLAIKYSLSSKQTVIEHHV